MGTRPQDSQNSVLKDSLYKYLQRLWGVGRWAGA
jgi:hypothetical protein